MQPRYWVEEFSGTQRLTGKKYRVPGHWRSGIRTAEKVRRFRNAIYTPPRTTSDPGAPNVRASVLRFLDIGFGKRDKLVVPNCNTAFARILCGSSARREAG